MSGTWPGAGRWGGAAPRHTAAALSPGRFLRFLPECRSERWPSGDTEGGRALSSTGPGPRCLPHGSTGPVACGLVLGGNETLSGRVAWSPRSAPAEQHPKSQRSRSHRESGAPLVALQASRPVCLGPGPFPRHTPNAWLQPTGQSGGALPRSCRPRWPLPATSVWSQGSPEVTVATLCEGTRWGRVAGDRWRWNWGPIQVPRGTPGSCRVGVSGGGAPGSASSSLSPHSSGAILLHPQSSRTRPRGEAPT